MVSGTAICVGVALAGGIRGSCVHCASGEVGSSIRRTDIDVLLPYPRGRIAVEQVSHLAAGKFPGGFAEDIAADGARNRAHSVTSNGLAVVGVRVVIAIVHGGARVITAAHAASIGGGAADATGTIAARDGGTSKITVSAHAANIGVRACSADRAGIIAVLDSGRPVISAHAANPGALLCSADRAGIIAARDQALLRAV